MGKREHIYKIIAENIRKERRRLGITQAELAERADVSLDTIKSVENGRRAMSLDTYLNIVHALESSPMVLMSQQHPKKHIERFAFIMNRCDEREIEFALHMIEQILRGQEDYLEWIDGELSCPLSMTLLQIFQQDGIWFLQWLITTITFVTLLLVVCFYTDVIVFPIKIMSLR